MVDAFNKRPAPTSTLLISVAELKENFLFGVDLTNDDGDPMPDSLFEFYIRSAQQWLEKELDIILEEKQIIDEYHDFYSNDYYQYSFLKSFFRPLQSVESLEAIWPVGSGTIIFEPEWFKSDFISGQLNLVPTSGTISAFLVSQDAAFLPLLTGRDYVPMLFKMSYTAGFKPEQIPVEFLEVIGMKAAIGPLNIAGDLIAGAGIANKSISLDGLSQSIGTTSSATNAGYGARILSYNQQIKEKVKNLKAYWRGMPFIVG